MKTVSIRGSALVMVMVASMFLIILTAGAFQYFNTNVRTYTWTKDRIQARLSAEAGVNLATHMLIAGATLPTDSIPEPILGTAATPFILPNSMGSAYVTVDPSNKNPEITSANAYMIRCIAYVPGTSLESFGMESIIMPENLARFSVFMDDPDDRGYYDDGYRFDGPFYANGPIIVYSSSGSHEDDVFFYSLKLTSDYYVYGQNIGGTHETTPAVGNLQMRPYQRLCLGKPYFELGADPIPFGSDELNWQGLRAAAGGGKGLYLTSVEVPNNARLVLKGTSLFVRNDFNSAPVEYDLSILENPVVWIENESYEKFYLRGDLTTGQGLDMALTLGTIGDVYMSGALPYANPDPQDPSNTNLLGIMSVEGDLIIADSPATLPDPAWSGYGECWQLGTDGSVIYSAVLVALDGVIKAENYNEPLGFHEFQVLGGYMVQYEGITSSSNRGFVMAVYFDPRLLYMHPPFFPTTASWNITMWAERADITVNDVTNGIPHY